MLFFFSGKMQFLCFATGKNRKISQVYDKKNKGERIMQPTADLQILKHEILWDGQNCRLSLKLGGKEVGQETRFDLTLHGVKDVEVSPHGQGLTAVNAVDGAPVVLMFAAPVGIVL